MAAQRIDISPIREWLDAGAAPAQGPQDVLKHLCRRLVDLGLPLHRVAVFVRTLHPNVAGRAFIWHQPQDLVEIVTAEIGITDTEQWLRSPVRVVFTEHIEIRSRIEGRDGPLEYPILDDLRKEGCTDFFAVPMRFTTGEVHGASFVTRRRGGFTDAELEALRGLMAPFSRVAEIYAWRRTARNILEAYLGQQTGEKVLAGKIRRGDGEDIRAVIWFCDLRDSTPIADSMTRAEFLRVLNEFYECILGPVLEHKGEVLRFIGDAALAIFPIGEPARWSIAVEASEACRRALAAARDASARIAADNAAHPERTPIRYGIGLHLGEVTYGNIGVPLRLEFTVIGPAANAAARVESMCKTLGRNVVISSAFAAHCHEGLEPLGRHAVKDVEGEQALFTLA